MNRSQSTLVAALALALGAGAPAACSSKSDSNPGVDTTRGTGGSSGSGGSMGIGGARGPVGPQTTPPPPAAATGGTTGSADASADGASDGSPADASGDGGPRDGTPRDGGDAASAETSGDAVTGALVFTGDFAMTGDRVCFKTGATGGTGNRSPALTWDGAPADTKSFAVTLFDTTNMNPHWAAYNIPATAKGLAAAITMATLPMGARQTGNWGGPGAPQVHRYEYKLWPLKVETLPGNPNVQTLRTTILPMNVIGEGVTIFAYGNTSAACM